MYLLKIATFLCNASERVEDRGGTVNVAPDKATRLLIRHKTGKKMDSPCPIGGVPGSGKFS